MNCKRKSEGWIHLLVFLIFTSFGYHLTAQQQVEIELVDKSFYKGPVYRSIDSTGVHVVIEGTDVLIPHDRVRNIRFIDGKKSKIVRDSLTYKVKQGYYHTLGMGLSLGYTTPGLTVGIVNGYQWNKHIGSGIGVGFEVFDNISTVPIYLELKGYLKKSKITPYYFVRPGYGIIADASSSNFNETSSKGGGIYWHLGVGYQFNFENASIAINIGSLGQDAIVKYSYFDWWSGDDTHVTEKHLKRRTAIRVEITF